MNKISKKKILIIVAIVISIILLINIGIVIFDYLNSNIYIKVKFSETLNKNQAAEILSTYYIDFSPGFILQFSGESVETSNEAVLKINYYIYKIKANKLKQNDKIIDISIVNIADYMPHLMPL